MKSVKFQTIYTAISILFLSLFFTSCKKLAGLPLQENQPHIVSTLDPHVNMSAWEYLKSRALGTSAFKDSILYRMYQGIIYSGIDTGEYTKPGRTFILMHNDAVLRRAGNPLVTQPDCYFGRYKVNGQPATKWEDYNKDSVKNYMLSLIVEGEHTFENTLPDPKFEKTLRPKGTDPLNPESIIAFRVINDRDSRFRINDFPGSAVPMPNLATPGIQARTAGILSTNGPVHVIDRVLFYQKQN
jgi:hypothetical protein